MTLGLERLQPVGWLLLAVALKLFHLLHVLHELPIELIAHPDAAWRLDPRFVKEPRVGGEIPV